jgi:hypothetical protein
MTGKLGGVDAEVAAAPEGLQRGVWIDVEARRVGDVENLPSEVERGALPDVPGFVESGVYAEDAIAAEGVSASSLARNGIADGAARLGLDAIGQRIVSGRNAGEGLRSLSWNDVPMHGYGALFDQEALKVPGSDPAGANLGSEGETGGETAETGELPTTHYALARVFRVEFLAVDAWKKTL